MILPRIRRRWKVQFHFKSGSTVTEFVRDLQWKGSNNELTWVNRIGQKVSKSTADYLRLDEIEAITSRKCWSFYLDWS